MAFLKQTLTLSTVGASLITSNSFWFFDFFGLQPIHNVSVSEETGVPTSNPTHAIHTSSKKITDNINKFKSASKHENIKGETLKNKKLKVVSSGYSEYGVDIILEDLDKDKNKYISQIISTTLEDFTLTTFDATEEEYKNFSKEEIKISLFTKAAWYSTSGEDEYSLNLDGKQINELFENKDEAKVKQLLLSLHKRLDWKKFSSKAEHQNKFLSELVYPKNLDALKELKIKYFDNFDSLKKYIHAKITTCEGEKIACIADKGELNVMETDQPSFFDNPEIQKTPRED